MILKRVSTPDGETLDFASEIRAFARTHPNSADFVEVQSRPLRLRREDGSGANLLEFEITLLGSNIAYLAEKQLQLCFVFDFNDVLDLPIEVAGFIHQDGSFMTVEKVERPDPPRLPLCNLFILTALLIALLKWNSHLGDVHEWTSNTSLLSAVSGVILAFFGLTLAQVLGFFKRADSLILFSSYPEFRLSAGSFQVLNSKITACLIGILWIAFIGAVWSWRYTTTPAQLGDESFALVDQKGTVLEPSTKVFVEQIDDFHVVCRKGPDKRYEQLPHLADLHVKNDTWQRLKFWSQPRAALDEDEGQDQDERRIRVVVAKSGAARPLLEIHFKGTDLFEDRLWKAQVPGNPEDEQPSAEDEWSLAYGDFSQFASDVKDEVCGVSQQRDSYDIARVRSSEIRVTLPGVGNRNEAYSRINTLLTEKLSLLKSRAAKGRSDDIKKEIEEYLPAKDGPISFETFSALFLNHLSDALIERPSLAAQHLDKARMLILIYTQAGPLPDENQVLQLVRDAFGGYTGRKWLFDKGNDHLIGFLKVLKQCAITWGPDLLGDEKIKHYLDGLPRNGSADYKLMLENLSKEATLLSRTSPPKNGMLTAPQPPASGIELSPTIETRIDGQDQAATTDRGPV